jgi:type I restriction enzyme S subunit
MRYVYYLLHASRLADLSQDVGVPGLSRDAVHGLPCPAWSCERQREIGSCLDRECARIERVAAAQAKLAALGTDAITSACAATFSGGTAAILGGDDGVRLRFLVREVDERAETRGLPLLSVTIDRGVARRDQLTDDLPRAVDLSNYKSVAARDIVVNRMRAFQGAVGVAPEDGIVSPDYLVLRVRSDNDPSLVARALASQRGADVMASLIRGIGGVENGAVRTPRINTNDLLDVRLRVPPAAEQAQIVAALEQAERDSQTLGGIARAVGDALARYRDSLIHEAVTGKLDVTAASDRQMDERLHAAAENRLDEVAV